MYRKDMLVMRIKLIALSQIRNIEDSVKRNPMAYRKDTTEYCDAMYDIIANMSSERLRITKRWAWPMTVTWLIRS